MFPSEPPEPPWERGVLVVEILNFLKDSVIFLITDLRISFSWSNLSEFIDWVLQMYLFFQESSQEITDEVLDSVCSNGGMLSLPFRLTYLRLTEESHCSTLCFHFRELDFLLLLDLTDDLPWAAESFETEIDWVLTLFLVGSLPELRRHFFEDPLLLFPLTSLSDPLIIEVFLDDLSRGGSESLVKPNLSSQSAYLLLWVRSIIFYLLLSRTFQDLSFF